MFSPSPLLAALLASGSSTRNIASSSSIRSLAARFRANLFPLSKLAFAKPLDNGILAGFTMVDVAVVLIDGSYHDVDSNEMAFKIAGSMAFKEACARAKAVLLEPIMKVEVVVPEEYMAQVFGDLNSRRSAIQGTENRAGSNVIRVEVPLAQEFGYATDLRSRTQGRATFTMHFSHYAELPAALAEKSHQEASRREVRDFWFFTIIDLRSRRGNGEREI